MSAARRRAREAALLARAARLRWTARPLGLAVVAHEVAATTGDPARELLPAIGAHDLRDMVRGLARRYRLVTATALPAAAAARRRGQRIPLALTFDDDLPSHVRLAAPILRAEGVAATFFVGGARFDGARTFWWEALQRAHDAGADLAAALGPDVVAELGGEGFALGRVAAAITTLPPGRRAVVEADLAALAGPAADARLTEDDVRRLAADGHEVGFHTRDHHALTTLADGELAAALGDGRARVATAAGRPVDAIAYPHGRADARVAAAARAAGFTAGYTTQGEPLARGTDPLLVGRVDVGAHSARSLTLALAWVLCRGAR